MSFQPAKHANIFILSLFVLLLSSCEVTSQLLGKSSSIKDIFTSVDLTVPTSSTPVTSSPVAVYPVDVNPAFFADDFNRADEPLITSVKWADFQGQAPLIKNQELNTQENGGTVYAMPSNPAVFPDLSSVYLESSLKIEQNPSAQTYLIIPYTDLANSGVYGCFFINENGAFKIYAGSYVDLMMTTLAPLATLTGYQSDVMNYVGCEVNQASGTATAYLNSVKIGTTENLTIPDAANSIPAMISMGYGIVTDNVKAFSSFAEGRAPNDGDLRIYNTPYAGYFTDQLANFSLQGYCANNGATVQIKDAAPGTFQSGIVTCTNNSFTINADLSNSTRFPSGANQIRIEYVNAGNTTEYTYNFSNSGTKPVPPSPPSLSAPTPTVGNSSTEFAWTVTYQADSVVNLTPAYVHISGDNVDCVASVSTVSATAYTVKVTGCTFSNGNVGIKILAGSAKNAVGVDFPESAASTAVSVVNQMPDFVISAATPTSGNENTTFRWTVDYTYATTISLAASYVQVLGANYGCSVTVVNAFPTQKYVDVANCNGNGLIGLKILAGSASNFNGGTPEKSTALNVTITNPIEIEFLQTGDSVLEGNNVNSQSMMISLSRPAQVDLTLSYSVISQFTTANSPTNTNLVSATVIVPAGQTTWPITYNYNGDLINQGTKIIQVALDGIWPLLPNVYIGDKQIQQRVVVDEESLDNYSQISAGGSDYTQGYTCGITLAGTAKCWGVNNLGQLGDGTMTSRSQPFAVSGADIYTMISAGNSHACGIISSGIVKCWGNNVSGQLGDGTNTSKLDPTTISGIDTYTMISAGGDHTCGITSAGVVKCWGANASGQLGDGQIVSSLTPVAISGGETYTQISAGGSHTCGITSSGIAKCWGTNFWGQLGDGSGTNSLTPVAVNDSDTYTKISASGYHVCGITSLGVVKCWGNNNEGAIGDGTGSQRFVPTAVSGSDTYTAISTEWSSSCGITSLGVAKCWGNNSSGALGDGTITSRYTPVAVAGSETYAAISLGSGHTCGITSLGAAKCWGMNQSDQLGILSVNQKTVPTRTGSQSTQVMISMGYGYGCGIASGGIVKCWGEGGNKLGNVLQIDRSVPTAINDTDSYTVVSSGVDHTCGVTTAGIIKCWGFNDYAQLGNGGISFSATNAIPARVLDYTDIYTTVSASFRYSCGLTSLGAVKCWGDYQGTPTAIGGGDSFATISVGRSYGCGLTTLGEAKCWGYNNYGTLGDGTTNYSANPIPISGGDTFTAVSTGWYHACGITAAGTVKCWGHNSSGQLGIGTTTDSIVPVAISDGTTYVKISAGSSWTCGITTAGLVKCWGNNPVGQLGDGTMINKPTPVAISDSDTYAQISAGGEYQTCGITTAGIIKCWGSNNYSGLGLGDMTSTITPRPVQQ